MTPPTADTSAATPDAMLAPQAAPGHPAVATVSPAAASRTSTIVLALAGIELLLLYAPTLKWLWARWTENVWEHAHGVLIVPLVGYFVYQELRARRPASAPNAWGFLFVGAALAMHVLDMGMQTQLLSAASIVVMLPGLFLLFLGTAATRAIAFPLSMLVLAVPIPLAFTEEIHWVLRRFATSVLGHTLPLLGVPSYTEGTTVMLANSTLEIADACSGFTTLYASIAVALLTAYTSSSRTRRVAVLLSAAPIAIAANLLRVLLLALLVVWFGGGILDTFVHPLSGMLTFALALPIIFWLGGDNAPAAARTA